MAGRVVVPGAANCGGPPSSFAQVVNNRVSPPPGSSRKRDVAAQSYARDSLASATCMEDAVDALAERALSGAAAAAAQSLQAPPQRRYMVGIAGPPGSGKSTLAAQVVSRINSRAGAAAAVQVPMDGYHLYRRQLDAMPDPVEAHARRGASWTFDAAAYVAALRRLKAGGEEAVPSFCHGTGDPIEADIPVTGEHRIVLSEGNYLLLDEEPWRQLADAVFDDTWYVDCDLDTAMQRVYARQTANGRPAEVVARRVAGNDRPNGELAELTKGRAALLVPSLPFRRDVREQ